MIPETLTEAARAAKVRTIGSIFDITNTERWLPFHVDGSDSKMRNKSVIEGKIGWRCLQGGWAALMLLEYLRSWFPSGNLATEPVFAFPVCAGD